jgi:hypothetical protein
MGGLRGAHRGGVAVVRASSLEALLAVLLRRRAADFADVARFVAGGGLHATVAGGERGELAGGGLRGTAMVGGTATASTLPGLGLQTVVPPLRLPRRRLLTARKVSAHVHRRVQPAATSAAVSSGWGRWGVEGRAVVVGLAYL